MERSGTPAWELGEGRTGTAAWGHFGILALELALELSGIVDGGHFDIPDGGLAWEHSGTAV